MIPVTLLHKHEYICIISLPCSSCILIGARPMRSKQVCQEPMVTRKTPSCVSHVTSSEEHEVALTILYIM